MVGKYDGPNDDSTRLSCISYRCGSSCIDRIFWRNWLFLTLGQIGYWAVKIVTGVPEAIPVIRSPLVELLRRSSSVGQSTFTRFYSLHTFVLPLLTAVFMLMRFSMIRKQGYQIELSSGSGTISYSCCLVQFLSLESFPYHSKWSMLEKTKRNRNSRFCPWSYRIGDNTSLPQKERHKQLVWTHEKIKDEERLND
ncbi:hypothetical protein M9H77_23619 [Catharanthus roseus]|uniref:Uncharacterized protein n=1 Tax=Catharanthus roseus TaxID=4058 RepID=A0ACC0AUK4_CATRO|nr:hypothetical protein M9H77_23619 [Catharanthus roseus]